MVRKKNEKLDKKERLFQMVDTRSIRQKGKKRV
jgi:hypothetical protein